MIHEDVNLDGLLDRAFRESDYHAKRERFARENPGATIKRGIGFASFMHGAGLPDRAKCIWRPWSKSKRRSEGCVRILAASTEIGQGTNTDLFADCRGRAGHQLRSHRNRAARYGSRAEQRTYRRIAHIDGRWQTRGDRRARTETRRWWKAACSATRAPKMNLCARAGATSKRAGRCARGAQYEAAAGPALGRRHI